MVIITQSKWSNFQSKIDELNESLKKFMQEKILIYQYVNEKLEQKDSGIWKN